MGHKMVHFIVAVWSVIFIVSCSQQPAEEPIKIGLSVNLSGRGGMSGEHIRDGAMLAVRDVNERGGINGRPLELLVRDDEVGV